MKRIPRHCWADLFTVWDQHCTCMGLYLVILLHQWVKLLPRQHFLFSGEWKRKICGMTPGCIFGCSAWAEQQQAGRLLWREVGGSHDTLASEENLFPVWQSTWSSLQGPVGGETCDIHSKPQESDVSVQSPYLLVDVVVKLFLLLLTRVGLLHQIRLTQKPCSVSQTETNYLSFKVSFKLNASCRTDILRTQSTNTVQVHAGVAVGWDMQQLQQQSDRQSRVWQLK